MIGNKNSCEDIIQILISDLKDKYYRGEISDTF
jgi:hypothetical protein